MTCTRGRGRDRRRVRPAARVRPRAPAARRGRRRAARDRRGRRPGPVVPACRSPIDGSSASGRLAARGQGERAGFALHHRKRADAGDRPRVERRTRSPPGWTTPSRPGSRGRSCTRRTSGRGATSSTTAGGCSRRCRSSRPARSAPRPPRRCPRSSAATATGTTATRGSATRRSRSRRCGWRRARTRPTSSSTT